MIVFTITNQNTNEVYVGTARNTAEEKWEQYLSSTHAGLDFPLYNDIRDYGSEAFTVCEWAFADSLEELAALNREAMQTFQGISLRGHKTVNSSVVLAPQNIDKAASVSGMVKGRRPIDKKVHSEAAKTVFAMRLNGVGANATESSVANAKKGAATAKARATKRLGVGAAGPASKAKAKIATKPPKIANGRTSNADKERRIKAAIAAEKEQRENANRNKVASEADEMAAILARLESRESTSSAYKNRRR